MAKIIRFPGEAHRSISFKISLYSDEEIFLTILAINSFGHLSFIVNEQNLIDIDPIFVISCLEKARESDLLSDKSKFLIMNILSSVEQTYTDNPK